MDNPPTYWLACSGGVDSVVLAHLLNACGKDFGLLHCNFHLRGEDSNTDEAFVRKLAAELAIPIRVKDFDTHQYSVDNRMNTQLAARELRYTWFDEVIAKENATVFIAHHYDDQVESFFLQLRRGGSLRALAGMPQFIDGYIRPLLKYSKKELIDLAIKSDWKWREDVTNASNDYMRNWYRNEVLPFLATQDFPLNDVTPLVEQFQEVLSYLQGFTIENEVKISDWLSYPVWFQEQILSHHQLGEYPAREITRLANAFKGKYIRNKTNQVWNEGRTLVFSPVKSARKNLRLSLSIVSREEIEFDSDSLYLDHSKIRGNLSIRKWEAGDRFQPLGMKGVKKVGKFLRDRKVPSHLKTDIYVLLDESEEILGVFGFCCSEKVKIDIDTQTISRVVLMEE